MARTKPSEHSWDHSAEHLLQAACGAVYWGGLGDGKIDERQGGPCPETAWLVEQADGQLDSN